MTALWIPGRPLLDSDEDEAAALDDLTPPPALARDPWATSAKEQP